MSCRRVPVRAKGRGETLLRHRSARHGHRPKARGAETEQAGLDTLVERVRGRLEDGGLPAPSHDTAAVLYGFCSRSSS